MRKVQSPRRATVLFTPQEKEIIRGAAHAVWNEIGYDVLTMVQEQDGKDTIPRAEVLELVCDAGRLEDQIRDADLRTKVSNASGKQLYAILRPAFAYSHYGM